MNENKTSTIADFFPGGKISFVRPPASTAAHKAKTTKVGTSKYVLLSRSLDSWGKIPQQQADLAKILTSNFEPGVEIPEAELFKALEENKHKFPSLANSRQEVTYLFRYYRGLRLDGKHAGFVARGFLKQVA